MLSDELVVRETEPDDLEHISELVRNTIEVSYADFYPEEALDYFLNYHSPESIRFDFQREYMLTALKNNSVIGTGMLSGRTVKRVFVDPEAQKSGCGKRIMDAIEQKAKKLHLDFLELHASLPSRKFYDKRGYKTLKFCRLPVESNMTLDYYQMAKMLRSVARPPLLNLNNRTFKVIYSDGSDTEINGNTVVTFSQVDELVAAEYHGGMVENGSLSGYVDGDVMMYHFSQTNTSGQSNHGNSIGAIVKMKNGKIRLIDRRKWVTKRGEGYCILETRD